MFLGLVIPASIVLGAAVGQAGDPYDTTVISHGLSWSTDGLTWCGHFTEGTPPDAVLKAPGCSILADATCPVADGPSPAAL